MGLFLWGGGRQKGPKGDCGISIYKLYRDTLTTIRNTPCVRNLACNVFALFGSLFISGAYDLTCGGWAWLKASGPCTTVSNFQVAWPGPGSAGMKSASSNEHKAAISPTGFRASKPPRIARTGWARTGLFWGGAKKSRSEWLAERSRKWTRPKCACNLSGPRNSNRPL